MELLTFEKIGSYASIYRHIVMLGAFSLLMLSLESCAKKSPSTKQSNGNDPSPSTSTTSTEKVPQAKGEPIDLPEAMATPRTHFQTTRDLTIFI